MTNTPVKSKNEFLSSVLGTKFRTVSGRRISEVGRSWPGQKKITIITAWNPNFKKASATQNKLSNAKLKKILENNEKKFQIIHAWWPNGSAFEESFAVENMTHGEARGLCRKFEQGGYFWANVRGRIRLVLGEARNLI